MQPWDRWWNRKFPPYSYRRLGFLLVCSLFISPAVALFQTTRSGEPFSWASAAMLWVGTSTMLTLSWIHIRGQGDLDDIEEAKKWRPPGMPPPPPPPDFPPDVWRDGRVPELPIPDDSEIQKEARARLMSGPASKAPRFDLLYSFLILLLGFTAFMAIVSSDPLTPMTFAMTAGCAAFTVLLFVLRYSILSVVLLAAVCAVPMAILMHMFFSWMGGGPIWQHYAIAFVTAFFFVLPVWMRFRESRKIPMLANIPMWILSSAATVMLVLTATASVLMSDPSTDPERSGTFAAPSAAPIDYTVDKSFGGSSREDAALRLFFAWKNNARATAATVAEDQAIQDLFSQPFDAGARFLGCGIDGNGYSKCATWTPQGLVLAAPHIHGNGNLYIVSVERVPHGHPFELSAQAAPTPTP